MYSLRHGFFAKKWPWLIVFLIVDLCCAFYACGERAGREMPSRYMDQIDYEEGERRLDDFRRQRLEGDFCFEFELKHKPRRAPTVRYKGIMWGTWNHIGPLTRVRVIKVLNLNREAPDKDQFVELIIQNGAQPKAWIRHSTADDYRLIEKAEIFEPILPDVLYSPYDLQMPFLYWEDFIYEGPSLIGRSRVAQNFIMQAPKESPSAERGIYGVRIALDDTYNALRRIEIMYLGGELASRFAVESFKKVQDQYIVKCITLTDYRTKDRTSLDVKTASVGLSLPYELFDPHLPHENNFLAPQSIKNL